MNDISYAIIHALPASKGDDAWYRSEREFKESIAEYMRFYNEDRPHKTLHYKSTCR